MGRDGYWTCVASGGLVHNIAYYLGDVAASQSKNVTFCRVCGEASLNPGEGRQGEIGVLGEEVLDGLSRGEVELGGVCGW